MALQSDTLSSDLQQFGESEQHASIVRSLLDHAPVGITVAFGRDAVIYAVSRHGLELIERENSQVTGIAAAAHPQAWQVYSRDGGTLIDGDDLPLTRACRGEEVRGEQVAIRSSSGRLIPILCNAGPIRTATGEVIGGVIAWSDITEMSRLVDDAENAKTEAQAATRAKDLFLAKISHDLRTPLGSVLGWVKIARARLDDRAQVERALNVIERSARTQIRLVDDLLDQNRIATGNLQLVLEKLNLAVPVLEAVEAMQPFAAERQVTLLTEIDEGELMVEGDRIRLQQVVCNLINNAVKFSDKGQSVRVRLRRQDANAMLEVEDDGIGLDPAHLRKVFEPFWQVPAHGQQGAGLGLGLGLGLAIVRHLVEAHGGAVSVTSGGIGKGCSFQLSLPAARS